ncbi:bifunctional sugar phosphate isomerase/epimerase/4-hydroxyphenylpyruvate dioxygenase family protein [Nonomuraea cavernae]|uniref:3-dehydroshikimate dehydratase n=1 Tax=Nonomuraea cavernae TaxID=2045107 RepID=A0A917YZW6_9ACTN|nr:sugar phosphate isomerase/epimerase and 4-hydroxyphenylpyruvate domain-containing protein [Nonomuraea cavernae]MCA2185969.1 sugar phosphate isomerase/epimerase and 4-hydroxyphenylpyruvate domain-containing protein [Nonomuraea cavernae]GGO69082.1 4-hydroxyphenylpyruvate dioxygenase [Nonomuraea cavernae]
MRKSIATVSVSGTLAEKLHAIAAAGFDGVEIFENDLIASPLSPEEVRARAADLGLGIDLYQPLRDFEAVPAEVLAGNLRRAERKFDLMRRLGADLLLVCSSVSPDGIGDDDLAAEHLHLLADRAARHGIRIAYEALAWGRHVSDYLHAWRVVQLAGHPNLGTCLDSFHILSRGSDPIGIEAIPGDKIFFLQLADAPRLAMDVLQWSRHYRCFPGQGGFDVAGLVTHVLKAGYQGPLSLEVFNDVFRQADTGRTAKDAMRSLLALEEAVGLAPQIPPPVIPTGFAFAELTVSESEPTGSEPEPTGSESGPGDTDGDRLRDLLAALGFARTGRHAAKPVELWEQRDARILLNTTGTESAPERAASVPQSPPEPAAAAPESTRVAPALAALGLESPDPAGSAARARSLLAPVLPRERGPDEAALDAIAAPDGTRLFFCRTDRPGPLGHPGLSDHPGQRDQAGLPGDVRRASWVGDFGPREPVAGPVSHIDHVALTQPLHHFDEAALFYRGVLGLRPLPSLELPDPYGLLRSKAMASDDGAVRMVLNIARVGGQHVPWQHIALACDDLVTTARGLRDARPDLLLPIPANYYDDLEARHDVPPELRELGLLYDRDEHGEFLHLYTITVGRVFFELVQRLGGYRGYGAGNAPVRLAVQHAGTRG